MTDQGSRLKGNRVKLLRERRGLSQDELGQMIGIPGKQMIRYEKDYTDPSSQVVIALVQALKTNSQYLLGLSDDDSPDPGELSSRERRIIDQFRRGDYGQLVNEIIDEVAHNNANPPTPAKPQAALDS